MALLIILPLVNHSLIDHLAEIAIESRGERGNRVFCIHVKVHNLGKLREFWQLKLHTESCQTPGFMPVFPISRDVLDAT